MKPVFEKTPLVQWESFHCEVVRGTGYNAAWHFHPEHQLTLVLESSGHRLVGDQIKPLHSGDLVLVGSNLPHVWQQDENSHGANRHVHAIIIRFLETFLGRDFLQVPEFAPIRSLLKRASRGLEVRGRTRERATAIILEMPQLKGMQRVARLLELLDLLAHSKELHPIASAGFAPTLDGGDEDRMKRVIQYINDRFTGRIDRQQVADCAHLSPGAFSRFFKLRTGKTLPQYVNELRVGRACRLLANEAAKVTDIAHECGFENLANFNRHFLKIAGMPPRAYRERLRQTAA